MKLRRFCSKCGITINGPNADGLMLCIDCTPAREIELPSINSKFTLRRCQVCGAFSLLVDGQEYDWRFLDKPENYVNLVSGMLYDWKFLFLEKKTNTTIDLFFQENTRLEQTYNINVHIQTRGNESEDILREDDIEIRKRTIYCMHCAKKLGDRFDAVIQLRIFTKRDKQLLEEILAACKAIDAKVRFERPQDLITKVEKAFNGKGYDLKISTLGFMRKLAHELELHYEFQLKRSKKVMGVNQENGSTLYRHYIMLRLIPFQRNDRVLIDSVEYIVRGIHSNTINFEEIKSKNIIRYTLQHIEKKKWRIIDESE